MLLDERYNPLDETGGVLLSSPVSTLSHNDLGGLCIELLCLVHGDFSQQTHLAAQRSRRNVQLSISFQHGLVVFGVLGESAVQVKASSHGARLTEAGAVMVDISWTDAGRVEAEAVVEVFDVDLLFPLSEHLGQVELLLEGEVPHARRVLEPGFVGRRAREGTFAPHDGAGVVWVACGVCVGDHAADVLTDDVDLGCDGCAGCQSVGARGESPREGLRKTEKRGRDGRRLRHVPRWSWTTL